MSNDFYNHGSFPTTGSAATSASMRAELDSIAAGFDKMPTLTGNANEIVVVNSSATGLDSIATLPATSGGTGFASYAVGDLLFASTTTALSKLADVATGNALISGGVGVAPTYGKIGLTTHVSGTLPVANGGTGITSFGTGVATALGINVGSAGAFVVNGGALGTPSSGTLTNATGLPVGTGISGLGTNVATALGVNVGSAGAFVVNGGALGTPSSGTVTNLTGTASININGTVGATTANTGAFTTLSATGVTTVQAGTAAAPAITTSGDTNTGIFFPAADTIAFTEGGVESMRIDSAGNLGIGTTAPTKKLELAGDAKFITTSGIGLQLHNNSSNQSYLQFTNTVTGETTTSGFQVGIDADEEGLIWHYRNEPIKFATDNTERMRLDSAGNLGLGVTPSAWEAGNFIALQVGKGASIVGRGGAGTEDQIYVSANAYNDGAWKYIGTGNATNYYQDNGEHVWRTAPSGTAGNAITFTQAMTLDASSRLLVGATASQTLSNVGVVGNLQIETANGSANATMVRNTANTTGPILAFGKSRGAALGSRTVVVSGDTLGEIRFDGADGTLMLDAASIFAQVDGTPGTNDMPGRLVFSTTADGGSSPTERMRIDSAGNLGLGVTPSAWGTTSSLRALELLNGAVATFSTTSMLYSQNAYYNGTNWIYKTTAPAALYTQTSGQHQWSYIASGTAGATITWSEAMRLDTSGRLLVGATANRTNALSSGTNLQIEGINSAASAAIVRNEASTTGSFIALAKSRGTAVGSFTAVVSGDSLGQVSFQGADGTALVGAAAITAQVDGTPGTNDMPGRLVFSTTADGASTPTERMRIDSAGNVNIATAGARITGDFSNATVANRVIFQTSTANSTTAVGVLPNGTSSTSRLQVFGASDPSNTAVFGLSIEANAEARFNAAITGTGTYLPMTFLTNASERMRIDTSGNVGIGTSSPSQKLDVRGSVYVQSDSNPTNALVAQLTNQTTTSNNGCRLSFDAFNIGSAALGIPTGSASLAFYTGGVTTERARITSGGNLEINSVGGYNNSIDRGLTIVAGGYNSTSTRARVVHIGGVGDNNNRCGWTPYSIKTNGVGNGAEYYIRPVTWTGSAFSEQASAGVYLTDNATSWTSASDERLKDIIEPITDAANKVSSLRAVIGKYKTDDEDTRRTFLIAQDVQAVLPEAVKAQEDEQGTLGLAYTDTIPLLVAAIKEQQAMIDELKAKVAALEGA